MNRTLSSALALALALIAAPSCSDKVTGPDGPTTDGLSADDGRVIATVKVTLDSSALTTGETTQAKAVFLDRNGNVLSRTVDWSTSGATIASVSGSGMVTARAAGVVSIVATHNGHSGSAQLTVTNGSVTPPPPPPPPPPPTGSSNEPSGMSRISDRPFSALRELGWDDTDENPSLPGGQIIVDASAPDSPPFVLRTTLPQGMAGGGGTFSGDHRVNAHTLYVSYWARLSSNWQGGGIHKQFYAYSNHASMYLDLYGLGSENLEVQIAGQDILAGGEGFGDPSNPDWTPKLAPARVGRSQWYHIEVLLAGNSDGKADGSVEWYLNGVHVGSHSGIQWSSAATIWNLVHFTNLWNGGKVPNTQSLDFDDFYVSGK